MADMRSERVTLDQEQTSRIMGEACNNPLNTTPAILMITALIMSFQRIFPDRGAPALFSEGHGREVDPVSGIDPTRTVGWFTTLMPIVVAAVSPQTALKDAIMSVKDHYQSISNSATENFTSRMLESDSFRRTDVEMTFNFVGRLQQVTREDALLKLWSHPSVHISNTTEDAECIGLLSILAYIDADERLTFTIDYNYRMNHQDRLVLWVQELEACLAEMAAQLPSLQKTLTRSDLPLLKAEESNLKMIHTRLAELEVPQYNVESIYPCTALQEGILFAKLKSGSDGNEYCDRFAFKLSSQTGAKVYPNKIRSAWEAVCKAHPILRTIFTSGLSQKSNFQQVVLKQSQPSTSIEQMPADCPNIEDLLIRQRRSIFMETQPPHHLSLYEASDSVVYAIMEMSHTSLDARTMQAIWAQIAQEYTQPSTVSRGKDFADYVAWLEGQRDSVQNYWRGYLAGAQPCLFPSDTVLEGATYKTRGPKIPFHDVQALQKFCQGHEITVAHFMQAAWGVVLRLYTGLSQVYFGCIRSDQDALEGAADILGPLATMLICKLDFEDSNTTALRLLDMAREDASRALQHSGCSLAELHDDLGLTSPLFDTIMTIQHAWSANLGLGNGDLVVEPLDGEDPTEYSISVSVHYSKEEISLGLSYQPSRLSESLVERVAETFAKVMAAMIEYPEQAIVASVKSQVAIEGTLQEENSILSNSDLSLLAVWNEQKPVAVNDCIPHRMRRVAHQQPLAPAVCSWDRNLDYGQLDAVSDYLAFKLRSDHGVREGMIVPFACEKAASAIVILLAISKAGAAFLPIDINHSPDRITTVLDDAGASIVLVNSFALHEKMRASVSRKIVLIDLNIMVEESMDQDANQQVRSSLNSVVITPASAAYAVYTSGSTGKPKGILVDHMNISTSADEHTRRLGITEQSRMLQLASFTFDVGLGDVVYALFAGACLCVPSEKERTDDIVGAINRMKANFMWATPTHATLLTPEDAPSLQTVALIGEPVRQENIETWAPHVRLINSYGPAEATVMASCRDVVVGDNSQDIGSTSCCRFWIVDPNDSNKLLPIGTTGELLIEGPLVARGYINNPDATAAAFIDAPTWTQEAEFASLGLNSQRFYRTGDLVTQSSSGSFIYEGRKDTQVKIRGLRIEMGEIEYHLNHGAAPGWHWVVEAVKPSTDQDACLAAFYECSPDEGTEVSTAAGDPSSSLVLLGPLHEQVAKAKETLEKTLPAYMVPEYFIHVQNLPTTSSMKTDRKSLRATVASLPRTELLVYRTQGTNDESCQDNTSIDARKELFEDELAMQQAWVDVLNIPAETICASDNFFNIGGNSIRAMHLVARLRKSGIKLSVADVFKAPRLMDMVRSTSVLSTSNHDPASESNNHENTSPPAPNFFPGRLVQLAKTWKWLQSDNIESVASATDTQAWMLSVGHNSGHGFDDVVTLKPSSMQVPDLIRLQKACEEVLLRHPILRTVFVQQDSCLLQVVLRKPPVEQVYIRKDQEDSTSDHSNMTSILPRFCLLTSDGSFCDGLELKIHHALYDAISLGQVLGDLSLIYAGQPLVARATQFHDWISHVSREETTSAQLFWKDLLRGSTSQSLLTPFVNSAVSGNSADSRLSISVPLKNLQVAHGTASTVLKGAWSIVLSQLLGRPDVTFGYISANRYSTTLPEVERIAGPCINILPVRALLNGESTIRSLTTDLQQQSNNSIPHQHVGFRTIIRDCTRWTTSRFNSIIVFQNHESLGNVIKLGDSECTFSGEGQVGDSADLWLTAMPQSDGLLNIYIHYSSVNIPHEQAEWISSRLQLVLNALPDIWEETIGHVKLLVADDGSERHLADLVDSVLLAGYYQYMDQDVSIEHIEDSPIRT